jgi:hypothetical protein
MTFSLVLLVDQLIRLPQPHRHVLQHFHALLEKFVHQNNDAVVDDRNQIYIVKLHSSCHTRLKEKK